MKLLYDFVDCVLNYILFRRVVGLDHTHDFSKLHFVSQVYDQEPAPFIAKNIFIQSVSCSFFKQQGFSLVFSNKIVGTRTLAILKEIGKILFIWTAAFKQPY